MNHTELWRHLKAIYNLRHWMWGQQLPNEFTLRQFRDLLPARLRNCTKSDLIAALQREGYRSEINKMNDGLKIWRLASKSWRIYR